MNEQHAYGQWASPLTPQDVAQALRLEDAVWNTTDGSLVWLEGRSGRGALVALPAGELASRELTPTHAVRARVGYGGGDFTVAGGVAFYVEQNGRLYRKALDQGASTALTPPSGHAASPAVSPDGRFVLYVHSHAGTDCVAIVDAQGRHWPQQVAAGADFYMQPRWHPSGERVAWVEWDHPHMPWDETRLVGVRLGFDGPLPRVVERNVLVGRDDTSVFQPEFSPDGQRLAFVDDRDGWWRLQLMDLHTQAVQTVSPSGVEAGVPAWKQGTKTYGFSAGGKRLFYLQNARGFWSLWSYDLEQKKATKHDALSDYTSLEQLSVSPHNDHVALLASSSRCPQRLVCYDPERQRVALIKRSASESLSPETLSEAQALRWEVAGQSVHGLFYAPARCGVESAGLPPLVVSVHGGPTAQRNAAYDAGVQFLTTRGYAVLQVNYRGSTGYGRAYREVLKGQWGVYDVEDCVAGARFLVEQKRVDVDKCVIMGGSAGGYTVLQALVHHPGVFKVGVCLFGVSNLFTLVADTHKFEARYLDGLIGPLPQASALYRERSPLFFAERIQDPVAVFQGAEDRVVPPSQSEAIVASLKRRGVPHEYHVYEGEGHGWRKRETVERFYRQLEAFLRQHVVFS